MIWCKRTDFGFGCDSPDLFVTSQVGQSSNKKQKLFADFILSRFSGRKS